MFDIMQGMSESNSHEGRDSCGPSAERLLTLLVATPAELTDGEVIDGLLGLVELSGRVQAAVARFAASFDARSLAAADGARSAAGWLAARTELARPAAAGAVACGRGLRHCPVVDAAAGDGRLGAAKVRALLDVREGLEADFARDEAELVAEVAPLTVAAARNLLDSWRSVMAARAGLDDGPSPADDPDRNSLHLSSTFQGRWRLDADLDASTGEALANAIDAWIERGVRAGALDPTTSRRSQLWARALTELVGVGAHASGPRSQPHADIHLSWDAADLLGQPVASMADLARRRCLTDRGTHLSRFAAQQALCNADVHDLLVLFGLDGSREVLGVTHTRRHATRHERAALIERDRGCVFPGCDAPVRWCDAHHTTPYEIGHHTRLDELVLLCPHHHRLVHRGFTLVRGGDGQITVTRPDGSVMPAVDRRYKLPPPDERAA